MCIRAGGSVDYVGTSMQPLPSRSGEGKAAMGHERQCGIISKSRGWAVDICHEGKRATAWYNRPAHYLSALLSMHVPAWLTHTPPQTSPGA
jgi:hypothetical protein